ncbi:MAG: hypothetical protein K6G34_15890 [Lachnospiraceae bacterium]|nr:hypothetical protein [Lachnospiraceae bacterium]
MARLTCVYCNNVISRSDTKCPYCGAETESSIKKFTAVREADIEKNKTLLAALNKSRKKQVSSLVCASFALVILSVLLFKFVPPSTAKTILFVVLVLAYAVCLGVGIKGIRKNSAERRELNARLDGLSHDIIFDCEEVEPYKMINDVKSMPNEGCYKEGLQQIAFKVSITNGSANKREFTLVDEFFAKNDQFGYHVRLNADGISMEDCKLVPFFGHHEESNKVFEPPLYKDGFQKIVLRPHDSISGWVAFYVDPKAKDLELLFADDYVMMKNPALADDNAG